jgi:hypothetical protein
MLISHQFRDEWLGEPTGGAAVKDVLDAFYDESLSRVLNGLVAFLPIVIAMKVFFPEDLATAAAFLGSKVYWVNDYAFIFPLLMKTLVVTTTANCAAFTGYVSIGFLRDWRATGHDRSDPVLRALHEKRIEVGRKLANALVHLGNWYWVLVIYGSVLKLSVYFPVSWRFATLIAIGGFWVGPHILVLQVRDLLIGVPKGNDGLYLNLTKSP